MEPSEIDVLTCNPSGPTGTIPVSYWILRAPTIPGPTDIRFINLPPDVHVVFTPTKLTYPGWATGEQVTATFTVNSGVTFADQVIEIEASDGSNKVSNQIILHGTCPRHNKDFTIRGSFFSNNVGVIFPMEGALVELYRDVGWGGADQHVGSVKTDSNGLFEAHLWANDEDTYYAKLLLNDVQGVYLHECWNSSIKDYNSALRGSNSDPVIDVGSTLITRDDGSGTPYSAVWQGSRAAYQEFINTNGSPPPIGDYEIVIQFTKVLTPWTARSTTNWEDETRTTKFSNVPPIAPTTPGFDPYFSQFNNYAVNFHEFGHALRHTVDGDQRHFTDDASRWTYGRGHGLCGSDAGYVDIEAFAFNEGWAEYWERVTNINCPGINLTDMTKEGPVALDLRLLSLTLDGCLPIVAPNAAETEKIRRRSMFAVLNRGQNIMHSEGEFRSNFSQQFPTCIVPHVGHIILDSSQTGIEYRYPPYNPRAAKVFFGEKIKRTNEFVAQLRRDINNSENELKKRYKNFTEDCDSCIAMMVHPVILKGQCEYLQLLNKAFKRRYTFLKEKEISVNDFEKVQDETEKGEAWFDSKLKEITKSTLKKCIPSIKRYSPNGNSAIVRDRIAYLERKIKILEINAPHNNEAYMLMDLPEEMKADKTIILQRNGKDVKY